MNRFQLTLAAAMLGAVATTSFAAVDTHTTRDERMDAALQNYRAKHGDSTAVNSSYHNDQPGPAARAENSVKRGFHRAGDAIKRGVHKTEDAAHRATHRHENTTDNP